jgi:hypothetical protein
MAYRLRSEPPGEVIMRNARMLAIAMVLAGCAPAGEEDDFEFVSFEEYIDGKSDTGYVGTRAAELEATFTGTVRASVSGSRTELESIATELRADPDSYEHRAITSQITEQIKYARNALVAESLNLNLEGGDPELSAVRVVAGGLELDYTLHVESLVKLKDLEERGLTVQDLVGRTVAPRLPLVPTGLFERIGNRCATDPDTGGAVEASELGAHNLFFYFDPARQGCPLTSADLTTGSYRVESSIDAPTVYPEYDRLVADGRVSMVAIFGQIEHGELQTNDWGFIAFNNFSRSLTRLGFRITQRYPENRGQRMEKTYAGGLVVSIDMQTPVAYADHAPREQANELFRTAIRSNEIVYYNGHAFYGSLTVLDDPSVYPADVYQIVFMDACWSYAYYTKQIFRNRASATDPDGYVLADVINNTEPGITGSETTAAILYDNLFRGAAAVRSNGNATQYSWNNLMKYMNDHAEERARRRTTHPDPEIYGVSGVRTNTFNPNGAPPPPPPPTGMRYENSSAVAIPDNATAGATSVITVPSNAGQARSVTLAVEIDHTYVGDLKVVVRHGGRELVLHDHSGGSADDLSLRVPSTAFAGISPAGEWSLSVVDNAAVDVGSITRWSLELTP